MINDIVDEVIKEGFELLLSRYQIGLKTLIRVGDFIFDYVYSLYYKCHKTNLNRSGWYISASIWKKKKKATINSVNRDDDKY